jgi:hypothetical protein
MVIRLCFRWSFKQAIKVAEGHFELERSCQLARTIGRIQVYGGEVFADEVQAALQQLQLGDPFGYSLVQRYLRAVVESKRPPKSGHFIGVVYQNSNTAGRLPWDASRFAAFLVRHAVRARMITGFGLPGSRRGDLIKLRRELRAMRLLNCHPRYFQDQLDQIGRLLRFDRHQRRD